MATNSAKYGALSTARGLVNVEWNTFPALDGFRDCFTLCWRELGARVINSADRRGFGTVVLERIAPQAVNGVGRLEYEPSGMVWTLEAPLNQVEGEFEAEGTAV